jgi:antitoxin component of MazEF toxin-antitoxin module
MGYVIKVQKVERPTNRSFYLNLPAVLAEALDIQKGEQLQWSIEDKNTLILSRLQAKKPRRLRHKPWLDAYELAGNPICAIGISG